MSYLIDKLRDPNVIYMTREAAAEVADALESDKATIERLTAALEKIASYDLMLNGAQCKVVADEALSAKEDE